MEGLLLTYVMRAGSEIPPGVTREPLMIVNFYILSTLEAGVRQIRAE